MRNLIFLLLLLFNIGALFAQNDSIEQDSFILVTEFIPSFPGGEIKLNAYLAENLVYPIEATQNQIEGKVYISFIVKSNGTITNVKLFRGIGYGCDEEALKVVRSMPNWIPGHLNGKPANIQMMLPIWFKLSNNKP